MSRSRLIAQGALAFAIMLAGITTVFVRTGDDDLGAPSIITTPTTTDTPSLPPSPTAEPTAPTSPDPEPSPSPTRVAPRAPLSPQEAEPVGVYEIYREPSSRPERPPRAEPAPRPVTCEILAQVSVTVEGAPLSPEQAEAMDATCVRAANVVRVYSGTDL